MQVDRVVARLQRVELVHPAGEVICVRPGLVEALVRLIGRPVGGVAGVDSEPIGQVQPIELRVGEPCAADGVQVPGGVILRATQM